MKPFTTIAVAVFAFVSLTHLCRIWRDWEIIVAGTVIPMWASYLGFLLAASLAVMLWRESYKRKL